MTTYPHRIQVRFPHVNVLLVAVVGLALALVGLGSWVLVDRYAGGGGATQDATALIDKFNAAGNAGDASALVALVTSDVVMRSEGSVITGAQALGGAATVASFQGLRVERIAPVTVEGDFATTFLRATQPGSVRTMLAVNQIKDGKIFRIWGFDLGVTPPFENAVMP